MTIEGTVLNNYNRIKEISDVHRREIDKINQYLRIIHDSKKEKVDALKREHEVWVKRRKTEIQRIEQRILEENKAFEEKRHNLLSTYDERESSFLLRKNAAEAYIEVVSKLNDLSGPGEPETVDIASDLEAMSLTSELDTMIDRAGDVEMLDELEIAIPDSEATKLFAA